MPPALMPTDRVLFQGDSITEWFRDKSKDGASEPTEMGRHLGCGYAFLAGSRLACDFAESEPWIRNLGISGNRIVDLAARAQEHIWNHRPTVLSILIGVNDMWHHFQRQAGVDLPRFERTYRQLLTDTRERLPDIRFVLCEPFLLPCGVVQPGMREDVDRRRAVVSTLADEFQAIFVPFQSVFDAACRRAPAAYWSEDGVHPSPAGHRLMADAWLAAVGYPAT